MSKYFLKVKLYLLYLGTFKINAFQFLLALLPYERYEMKQQSAQIKYERPDESDENGRIGKSEPLNMTSDRQLTLAKMSEIQRQIKTKSLDSHMHVEMAPMPVTVIVGHKSSSPSEIQIQQPHTTITVHQTTIHPQTLQMPTESQQYISKNNIQISNQIQIQQITLQSASGTSNCNIKQDGHEMCLDANSKRIKRHITLNESSGREGGSDFLPNQHIKHGQNRAASLRHVRAKPDRSKDWSGSRRPPSTNTATPTLPEGVTVSAMKPNEKENIPYLSGSKTTTITPILGNSNKSMLRLPTSSSEIIDLVDSDNDSGNSPSPIPQSQAVPSSTMFPNMKKRKLDILRQGGLEVTAINNAIGPLNGSHTHNTSKPSLNVPSSSSNVYNISTSATQINTAAVATPTPMFQSKCMYTKTSRIFGNPKDLIPVPTPATNTNCLDLTIQRGNCQDVQELLRLPPTTTIRKAHTSSLASATNLSSSLTLSAHNITDPNLQITLVPPLTYVQSIHNSQNHNIKRKSSEMMELFVGQSPDKMPTTITVPSSLTISAKSNDLAAPFATASMPSAASPLSAEPNAPSFTLNDMKISQMMLQNFLKQNSTATQSPFSATQMNPVSVNDQYGVKFQENSAVKLNTTQLASMPQPRQLPPGQNNPFLPMLDPMYLSSLYQTQNLFFPQTLPQELMQLYKKFPEGLGIIPISKS